MLEPVSPLFPLTVLPCLSRSWCRKALDEDGAQTQPCQAPTQKLEEQGHTSFTLATSPSLNWLSSQMGEAGDGFLHTQHRAEVRRGTRFIIQPGEPESQLGLGDTQPHRLQVLSMPPLAPGQAVSPRGLGMPDSPSCPPSSLRSGWSWCGSGTCPAGGCWLPSAQPGHLHSELGAERTHQGRHWTSIYSLRP